MLDSDIEEYDIVEVKLEGYTYDSSFDGKYTHFSNKKGKEEWVKAFVVKRAKNGSIYADLQDHYDSSYSMRRWFKKGKWREFKL